MSVVLVVLHTCSVARIPQDEGGEKNPTAPMNVNKGREILRLPVFLMREGRQGSSSFFFLE